MFFKHKIKNPDAVFKIIHLFYFTPHFCVRRTTLTKPLFAGGGGGGSGGYCYNRDLRGHKILAERWMITASEFTSTIA
ncbi:hypothetical protein HanRHA438_Chr13g0606791 [Helianthus annuus]|nr:hypothetical protein HanIR_Chr13g0648491 [Helianthus annuus]KAJ0858935.1 hypothetical protein HanRHA438_Chr13g0606791 [Helianthus annuus]